MGSKGYAVGFDEYVRNAVEQLPQREVIQGALRKQHILIPEAVLRELFANALIHQDFEVTGIKPMVEIYADRVEISNPGRPMVDTDRFIDTHRPRNERLADLMRRFNICEEKGSGIDQVVRTAEDHLLPAPDFRTGLTQTHVIVYGQRDFAEMDRNDRIRACYQHCALQWVNKAHMTNQSLRTLFGLPKEKMNSVAQVLKTAIDSEYIKRDPTAPAARKSARYIPIWA